MGFGDAGATEPVDSEIDPIPPQPPPQPAPFSE
jgi:hypothetical protein